MGGTGRCVIAILVISTSKGQHVFPTPLNNSAPFKVVCKKQVTIPNPESCSGMSLSASATRPLACPPSHNAKAIAPAQPTQLGTPASMCAVIAGAIVPT